MEMTWNDQIQSNTVPFFSTMRILSNTQAICPLRLRKRNCWRTWNFHRIFNCENEPVPHSLDFVLKLSCWHDSWQFSYCSGCTSETIVLVFHRPSVYSECNVTAVPWPRFWGISTLATIVLLADDMVSWEVTAHITYPPQLLSASKRRNVSIILATRVSLRDWWEFIGLDRSGCCAPRCTTESNQLATVDRWLRYMVILVFSTRRDESSLEVCNVQLRFRALAFFLHWVKGANEKHVPALWENGSKDWVAQLNDTAKHLCYQPANLHLGWLIGFYALDVSPALILNLAHGSGEGCDVGV